MRKWNTPGGVIFDSFNYIILIAFALCTVLPFIYIIAGSFSTDQELQTRAFFLIPKTFSLDAYKYIFSNGALIKSIGVSIYITVVGTIVNLFFTMTMAYPLSRKTLWGRNRILGLVIFSMLFSGGMIPTYMVVKDLGLLNSYWSLMLPGAISAFNLIIVKNFFQELPQELEDAAKIDGCNEIGILWRIYLPLSKPIIATFALFYAVGHWNDFMGPLLYINDPQKWPLQVILRQVVELSQAATVSDTNRLDPNFVTPPAQTVKMATIAVGTIPILIVYPFLQKYFTKGVLLGSVKS
ncbi:carbohydrate ABC transporter permease [Pullulanibacillus sp. KACC 23026]|uniref:carbohydrate ABC transporter permease n=1 Tax=Pullulanibacillus sp. KACC 23026 TaxID=3028315 RepID=UPI0023B20192|nr:carbohydrate ABC transporter permease [Pullulanibacillus sp. KACC 23026]WEG13698.1 carbohydrate ABC transporter permease [Pullulanibacillus sp. KACC 23026]